MSMQIKQLSKEGVPKVRIASQLGVSRSTVYNHLGGGERPKPRKKRVSKLDRFQGYIESRLEQFDLPCTVLRRELVSLGYDGGLTILRDYVRPLKRNLTRRVSERFETEPGRQAQIDWGECGSIAVGGERKKLYVFVLVLGYSRKLFARFTTSSRLPALLACLQAAFGELGIPRQVLVDNMRQAVDQHDVSTGTVRWNKAFLDFADHHGFLPAACPPYWPRAKGKVERGVGYIKRSFLEGRSFTNLADLNRQIVTWVDTVANVRDHGTTGARPVEFRVVSSDSHISFSGVRYSVAPVAVGRTVSVRPEGDDPGATLNVYLADQLVAMHKRAPRGSRDITLAEHRDAVRILSRKSQPGTKATKAPCFVQLPQQSPDVEVRSLAAYDAYAEEVAG
jgi:transposase